MRQIYLLVYISQRRPSLDRDYIYIYIENGSALLYSHLEKNDSALSLSLERERQRERERERGIEREREREDYYRNGPYSVLEKKSINQRLTKIHATLLHPREECH